MRAMFVFVVVLGSVVLFGSSLPALAQTVPTIDSAAPSSGPSDGNTELTLRGSGFGPDVRVALQEGGLYVESVFEATGHTITDFELVGDMAVCSTSEGLLILDISDPTALEVIGENREGSGDAFAMNVEGDRAYAVGVFYLDVFDISDPVQPRRLGTARDFWDFPWDVAADGDRVYVTQLFSRSVLAYDVSNPEEPRRIGSARNISLPYAVEASDGLVYVAAGWPGLTILDFSDPSTPETLSTVREFSMQAIELVDERAYLGGSRVSAVVDVSDPSAPHVLQTSPLPADAVAASGGRFYGSFGAGIHALEVSDPSAVELLDVAPLAGPDLAIRLGVQGLDVSGRTLVALGELGELFIFDTTLAERPSRLATPETTVWRPNRLLVDRQRLVLAGSAGVEILDAARLPEAVSQAHLPGNVSVDVAVTGDLLASLDAHWSARELALFDISEVSEPEPRGTLALERSDAYLAAAGDHVLVSASYRLQIVDVADPDNPAVVGELRDPERACSFGDLRIRDSLAYVACEDATLAVVDLTDPTAPELVTVVGDDRSRGTEILIAEASAFVGGAEDIHIVDLAAPRHPVEVGRIASIWRGAPLALRGDELFVGTTAGMLSVDVGDPSRPIVTTLYEAAAARPAGAVFADLALIGNTNGFEIATRNPAVANELAHGSDRVTATVPAGFAPGPYHVAAIHPNGGATILGNGFRVLDSCSLEAALDPHPEPEPPLVQLPISWRVTLSGSDEIFEPEPRHEAYLALPDLPDNLEITHQLVDRAGLAAIELRMFPSEEAGLVTLFGADPEVMDEEWQKIAEHGRIALPPVDDRSYGDLVLRLQAGTGPAGGATLESDGEELSQQQGSSRTIYSYELADGTLRQATAWGAAADHVIRAQGTTPPGCEAEARLSYLETVARECEEFMAEHPDHVLDCPEPPPDWSKTATE
jgi:hypothetical protein